MKQIKIQINEIQIKTQISKIQIREIEMNNTSQINGSIFNESIEIQSYLLLKSKYRINIFI